LSQEPSAPVIHPVVVDLPSWRDPHDILGLFAAEPMPALLHSAGPPGAGHDIGRWSFLSARPVRTVAWSASDSDDPFQLLEQALGPCRVESRRPSPFVGGAIGFLGYDAAAVVEPSVARRRTSEGGPAMPAMLFGLYDWTIVWDHANRRWWVSSTGLGAPRAERLRSAERTAREVAGRATAPHGSHGEEPGRTGTGRWIGSTLSRGDYMAMVEAARDLIRAGEIYQVNLSQRLEIGTAADPVDLYRGMARLSAAPFAAYLDTGSVQILSASPERFVSLRGRVAETRPIKGTRPRGSTPLEDERLRRELSGSEKDRAENVMIVDLARNDLGRVCEPGSIRAEAVCRLESYASVHHLTSVIRGTLRPEVGRAALLRAVFPPGSMTGAPKVRAMQAIEDLEPCGRGIYSGALGYLSFCGNLDLSVVIRTAIVRGDKAWLQVGGGIVADSDPAAEHAESLDKARSVMAGLGITERWQPGNRGS